MEDFPGGLVGRLGDKVKEFIRNNTGDASGDPYAKKMAPLALRLDAARDWTPTEVAALLDDIAAVTSIPLETTMEEATNRTFRPGAPLPPALANAPWGEALPNGLRLAWLLEPRAAEYPLGTPLKSRILIHNSSKNAVVFRTRTWHQSAGHKARDAKGAEIPIESTFWTTIALLVPFRLARGEFIELTAAGIGVGRNKDDEDWQGTRVGAWIDAKAGDEVTFMPDSVPASDRNEPPMVDGEAGWWPVFIAERLNRELPLPAAADERTRLLDRVMRDLFGSAPTAGETAAFTADHSPAALESLGKRCLVHRPGVTPFAGALTSGPTKFRVLPVDPDAATKPRIASNPGRYTLGESIQLIVSPIPKGTRIVVEARISFLARPDQPPPGAPREKSSSPTATTRGPPHVDPQFQMCCGCYKKKPFTATTSATPPMWRRSALGAANPKDVPKPILDVLRATVRAVDAPAAAAGK